MQVTRVLFALALAACGGGPKTTTTTSNHGGAVAAKALPALTSPDDFQYADEPIGPLRFDMEEAAAVEALGFDATAAEREGPSEMAATGDWVVTLAWPQAGVRLAFFAASETARYGLAQIGLDSPSTLRLARGDLGLGSTVAEVQAAFGPAINAEHSVEDSIVVGSLYGGITFSIADGKVVGIGAGAGAE